MSERQRELIHDLRIELEETRAKLASAEKRASEAVERIATAAATDAIAQQTSALKAQLAASQGREAAMRAALESIALGKHTVDEYPDHPSHWVARLDCVRCRAFGENIDHLDKRHASDCPVRVARAALATDGSGWVSPETVSGLVEALEEMLRLTPVGQHCVAICRPGVDEHHTDCIERRWRAALATFENSKRGGK